MTDTIKKSIDNGKFGCEIFIDVKEAFDTVNHTVLLKKYSIMVFVAFH